MRTFAASWRALAFVAAAACAAQGHAQTPQRRIIRITAERFAFTPSEIVIASDEDVEFRLKSDDTSHGFRIAGTTVNITIPKRGRDEIAVPFKATRAGRYTFECSRMCGAGHNFMRGVLVVRDRTSGPRDR